MAPAAAAPRGWLRRARASIRGLLNQAQGVLDRRLHDARRTRAQRVIAELKPKRVLVLCYGNICRSPYAAAVLTRATIVPLQVVSAGLIKPGRPSPDHAQSAAAARGIDISPHRSQILTRELIADTDLIVVMEKGQQSLVISRFGVEEKRMLILGDLDPEDRIPARTIADPYGRDLGVFADCYTRIDRCVDALAAVIARVSAPQIQPFHQ